ncbi:hypothetical protein R6Q59_019634 [Mikania micrantha]
MGGTHPYPHSPHFSQMSDLCSFPDFYISLISDEANSNIDEANYKRIDDFFLSLCRQFAHNFTNVKTNTSLPIDLKIKVEGHGRRKHRTATRLRTYKKNHQKFVKSNWVFDSKLIFNHADSESGFIFGGLFGSSISFLRVRGEMAVAFSQISWWLWSGYHQDTKIHKRPSKNSSTKSDINMLELDNLKLPLVNVASTSKRVKRKCQSRRERTVDKEYDVVLVPSDGGCLSGSESNDSDWSIGWLEPHGAGFCSDDDDDSDDSFAVLVPCYGRGHVDVVNAKNLSNDKFTIGKVRDIYSAENETYMEQWLSSLQHN